MIRQDVIFKKFEKQEDSMFLKILISFDRRDYYMWYLLFAQRSNYKIKVGEIKQCDIRVTNRE